METTTQRSMSGLVWGVIIAVIVIGGLIWYQAARTEEAAGGELYIGITDETANIENVNEVSMEIEKIEVHSATGGWVTVSEDSKLYNLLKLKAEGRTELYAKAQIDPGVYDRVRVTLGDVVIQTKENGEIKAFSPSNHVVINMDINVSAESDTHVELDFLADRSLHTTGDNQFVFAPVINAQSQSNTSVTVASDNGIATNGGTMDSSASIGVDLNGTSRNNFALTTTSDLKVDASDENAVKFMIGSQVFSGTSVLQEEAMDGALDINADVNGSSNVDSNNNGSNNSSTDLEGTVEGALDVNLY
jgi:hypothetical protein